MVSEVVTVSRSEESPHGWAAGSGCWAAVVGTV